MRVLSPVLLILISSIHLLGQSDGSISGTVIRESRSATGFAVLQRGNKEFARSRLDSKGRYSFSNLSDGNYRVLISIERSGAFWISRSNDAVISNGDSVALDFDFSEVDAVGDSQGTYPIMEVVNVSAAQSQTIDEVSKTVDVIEGQELRDRADFSLAEALRTIPGFRVQQLGGFGRTANIKTRGLRNQDTAVLIDGIRFRDPSSITGDATPFLSDITLTSVNRIEVLRGSGSSLYGTNAIGGTIDFQTPVPKPGFHGQIGGALGGLGLGRFRGNVSDGTRDGMFGFTAGVSRTVYTKGIDGQDNAHNTNFQSRFEYSPFRNATISVRVFVSDAFVRLNSDPDTSGAIPQTNAVIIPAERDLTFASDVNDPDSTQRSQFANAQVVGTNVFNNKLAGQVYYSLVRTSRKNDNGPRGIGFQSPSTSVFTGVINTFNGHMDWTPHQFNTITGGYEFENEKFENDGFTPEGIDPFSTDARQSSHTMYFQDLLGLFSNRLRLAGSLRVQHFGLSNPAFSTANAPYTSLTLETPPIAYTFDGAISYILNTHSTKIRAHVGNGYRIPSLYERFGTFYNTFAFPAPRFEALGDPYLRPERTIAADLGIEQSIWHEKVRMSAAYFYTKLINTIGFGNVVPDIASTRRNFGGYYNTEGGISRGVEVSGRFDPFTSLQIFASYTFTNSDQMLPQISGNPNIETLGVPKHQFTLVATQRFKRFWINTDVLMTNSYLASIFDTRAFTFRSYVYRFNGDRKMDITCGYTFPIKRDSVNLRLYGTIENVLDNEYYENGFQTPGRNGRIGLSFSF